MNECFKQLSTEAVLVSPSILASDFKVLGNEIMMIEEAGADLIHIDVMDGHFVPNISFGVPIIKSIRALTDLPFDVHIMISNPLQYIKSFVEAGADIITFHLEANGDTMDVIREIRKNDCAVGISVKPNTPAEDLFPYLEFIDLVLVMTVEPGFGGQSFMVDMMPKIVAIKQEIEKKNLSLHIEVDGGIDEINVEKVLSAGANMLVAGTSVFKHTKGAKFAITQLKK